MKRLLVSMFALSLTAPAWAQDDGVDEPVAEQGDTAATVDAGRADNGPSEDEIGALLDLLDAAENDGAEAPDGASVSARPVTDPCDLVSDQPDLIECEDVDAASGDGETTDDTGEPDLESLLRLDGPEDEPAAGSDAGSDADADVSEPPVSVAGDDATDGPADADNPDAEGIEEASGEADPADETTDGVGTGDDATDTADEAADADSPATEAPDETSDQTDPADEATDGVGTDDDATAPEAQALEDGDDSADAGSDDATPDEADAPDASAEVEDATQPDAAVDAEAAIDVTLTTGAPFLTSDEYTALRADSLGEQLQLVWTIRRENSDGEPIGETSTRTLYMAPDFVRDESDGGISIFDFLTDRHLEIDAEAETLLNTGYAGEVRRRLDTYLRLSQGGRLQDIPISADRSFDRFWLEAAMGIRREPVTLTHTLDDGDLSVERRGGLVLMTARFDIDASGDTDDVSAVDEEIDPESEESQEDALRRAATPIDLSSDESVVFDPSQAALPINLNLGAARINYPESLPAEQAQAELFRRWMRHALPIHPDVLSALEGAPHIPTAFSYYIISPESPAGRREIWTLESMEITESGFRLEPGLSPHYSGPDWISESVVPAAISARDSQTPFSIDAMLEEIEQRREADDNVGAYLVSLQEQHHFGPCPTLAEAELRAVCSATSSVVASGLGDPGFEALFGVLSGPSPSGDETLIETLQPYLGDDDYAGAAARILTAKALLRWAARDPDNVPDEHSPFDLFAEAIEIDPLAGAAWWEAGNALLVQRDPLGAWTVFDTGRSILPEGMIQVIALEDRLRVLAPEFFLPR